MMKIFKKASAAILILCLSFSSAQAAKKEDTIETILSLGIQMSNLVNMLETYALVGLSVSYKTPVERLKNGITDYDMMLVNLETSFQDKEIQQSVQKIRASWKRIRRALYGVLVLTDKNTMKLNSVYINKKLRLAIKELAIMKNFLLKKVKMRDKALVDAAINIGLSIERLSANYMMKIWEVDDPEIKKYWDKNLNTFSSSLKVLQGSSFAKDKQFKKYLTKCGKELKYFTVIFGLDMRVPALVHEKAFQIVDNSNKMINMILVKR